MMQDALRKSSEKYEKRIDGITLNLSRGNSSISLKICFEPGSLFGRRTTKCLPLSVRLLKSSFACCVVFDCSEVTGWKMHIPYHQNQYRICFDLFDSDA